MSGAGRRGINRRILAFILIPEEVFFGEHALVQNTGNQYPAAMLEIEHDVHPVLEPMQSGMYVIAESSQ